jgi:hypothetical protein
MVNLIDQFLGFQPGRTGIKKDGPDSCEGGVHKIFERIHAEGEATAGKRSKSKYAY